MKRILLTLTVAGLLNAVQAQDESFKLWGNYPTDTFLLDFNIPDLPAFKALGTEPSTILRPSDVKKFALSLNPFYSGGEGVIPKAFALEVAPWKLASKNLTLKEYREKFWKRTAYNTSFSLGSSRENDANPLAQLALGIRTSIRGKNADPMINSAFLDSIYQLSAANLMDRTSFQIQWCKENNVRPSDCGNFTGAQKTAYEQAYQAHTKKVADSTITRYISRFKQQNWNATRYDLALALVGVSSDSLLKNIQYGNAQFWATGAFRVGSHGQLLVGTNLLVPDSGKVSYTGNLRFYLGTQNFRGFAEAQYRENGPIDATSALLNLGAEVRVMKYFWLEFYAGVQNFYGDADQSRFVSSLNLKYAFNN